VNKKLTLSNGLQIRFELHETKRLKRLQRIYPDARTDQAIERN